MCPGKIIAILILSIASFYIIWFDDTFVGNKQHKAIYIYIYLMFPSFTTFIDRQKKKRTCEHKDKNELCLRIMNMASE